MANASTQYKYVAEQIIVLFIFIMMADCLGTRHFTYNTLADQRAAL
jgi:hypothetical protein